MEETIIRCSLKKENLKSYLPVFVLTWFSKNIRFFLICFDAANCRSKFSLSHFE